MMRLCDPKRGILTKTNPRNANFRDDDLISVKVNFTSATIKINYIPLKVVKKKSMEPTVEELSYAKQIRKEREYVIQAKIVKTMKTHREYPYQSLIADVVRNIQMF